MKKKIFIKNKRNNFLYFFFFFIIFVGLLILYYQIYNNKFIKISQSITDFYIIPIDKGGEKIINTNKKSLNPNLDILSDLNLIENNELLFSIQFYTNSNYDKVVEVLNANTSKYENIYNLEDFYILALSTDLGIEYFLLYKNFESRNLANEYCNTYLTKLKNCYILDVKNFKN